MMREIDVDPGTATGEVFLGNNEFIHSPKKGAQGRVEFGVGNGLREQASRDSGTLEQKNRTR